MEIQYCIGNFFLITADKNEEINQRQVQRALQSQKIRWSTAKTRYSIRNKEALTVCDWVRPDNESEIRLKFKTDNPYVLALFVLVLNNWGYNAVILDENELKEKMIFKRSRIFFEDEIAAMMGD